MFSEAELIKHSRNVLDDESTSHKVENPTLRIQKSPIRIILNDHVWAKQLENMPDELLSTGAPEKHAQCICTLAFGSADQAVPSVTQQERIYAVT